MNLPKEAIVEFQNLYSTLFGINISFEKAKVEAEIFIKYFDLIGAT